MPEKVIVFGHSFVRRLEQYTNTCTTGDIKNLGLCTNTFGIQLYGLGGLCMSQRRRLHSCDSKLHGADMVLLDIGSNDLCDPEYDINRFVTDLVSFASYLVTGLQVRKVIVLQIIKRARPPFSKYNDNVVECNVALKQLITTKCQLPIYFWRHRGMWNTDSNIFHRDGVHLSIRGYEKYLRSVRDCIIRTSRW